MPLITIHVDQSDLDAAARIARKMLPERPDFLNQDNVIASAFQEGMRLMRKAWNEGRSTEVVAGPSISESEDARRSA